jgi:hypothetical protein
VRIAEARHIADQRIVTGGERACRALMISQLSSSCKIDRSFGGIVRSAATAPRRFWPLPEGILYVTFTDWNRCWRTNKFVMAACCAE